MWPPGCRSRGGAAPEGGAAVTSLTGAAGWTIVPDTDGGFSPHQGFYLRSPHGLDDTQNTPHPSSSSDELSSTGAPREEEEQWEGGGRNREVCVLLHSRWPLVTCTLLQPPVITSRRPAVALQIEHSFSLFDASACCVPVGICVHGVATESP